MSSTTEPPPPPRTDASEGTPILRAPAAEPAGARHGGTDWRRLHLHEIQFVRDLLIVAIVVGIVYMGYVLRPVTVPMLLAVMLAYLFEPLIKAVTRRGIISRQGAAVGIIVAAGALVVAPVTIGVGFAVVQGTQYAAELARDIRAVRASVDAPENQRLRAAVPEGAWTRIRDYLVELEQPEEESPAPEGDEAGDEAGREVAPAGEAVDAAAGDAAGGDGEPGDGVSGEAAPAGDALPGEAAEGEEQTPQSEEVAGGAVEGEPVAARAPAAHESAPLQASVARRVVEWLELNAAGIGQAVGRQAIGTGATAVGAALNALAGIGYMVFAGVLTAFFFFFFSTGWGKIVGFWESLVPQARRGRVVDLVTKMDRVIAGFVRGRLTIVGLLAVYMTAAYWLIGVPAPLVLGPIIGLLFIVPFVHIVGVPIAMLLMWLEPPGGFMGQWWWIVFAPIGVYLVAQALDDWVLTPVIQGKSTDMDTPTILFASLAGGVLAGVYGLLLAIPVAACIKILIRELVWPRVHAWVQGRAKDLLPIGDNDGPGA